MRKLLFTLSFIVISYITNAQSYKIDGGDSVDITYTLYKTECSKAIGFQYKTKDNIYFTLAENSYMISIPDICMEVVANKIDKTKDIGLNLIFMVEKLRIFRTMYKNSKEILFVKN